MSVGRLLSRASSTAQFTATVVVPAPPLAPKNTSVASGGWRAPAGEARGARPCDAAPWNVSSGGGHVKNSLAPARIACRIRSGSAVARDGEDRHRRVFAAQPLDRRHRPTASSRDVDDDQVGCVCSPRGGARREADRDAAGNAAGDLRVELVVLADDRCSRVGP